MQHKILNFSPKVGKLCPHHVIKVHKKKLIHAHSSSLSTHTHSHTRQRNSALFFLSRNNTSIHYRSEKRQRVTKGAERGALCAFCLLPEEARTHLTNLLYIRVFSLLLIHPALSGAPSSSVGLMLNGERQSDSTLKWFTGMKHSPLRAAMVIELMSKQFIAHLHVPS